MTTTKVPAKKRKVSKKTKRSWRKNVDITDVDKFLENARFEERLGPPISEVPDSELFTIDTSTKSVSAPIVSKSERRLRLLTQEPKCFELLKPHTKVPDPITKRNRVRTPEERMHPIRRKKEAQRKLNGQLKLKEKVALRNKALAEEKRAQRPKRGEYEQDVWDSNFNKITGINTEWMSSDSKRHTLAILGVKKKKLPASLHKKTSVLSAVEAPHPGTSYNPSYDDHQDLLREIAEKEKKLIKEEEHLNRVTTKMFAKLSPAQKERNRIKELSQGLPLNNQKSVSEEKIENEENNEVDNLDKFVNGPAKNVKKTLQQKRKQREQKELARLIEIKRIEKKKTADLYKLKQLEKLLEKKQKKEEILREKRLKLKAKKSTEAKTLSKVKFEPAEQEFNMPSEISGNLRNTKVNASLLKDRFKSLQQRNIVAPSTLVLKRTKTKVKKFIKADHKIPEIHGRK